MQPHLVGQATSLSGDHHLVDGVLRSPNVTKQKRALMNVRSLTLRNLPLIGGDKHKSSAATSGGLSGADSAAGTPVSKKDVTLAAAKTSR